MRGKAYLSGARLATAALLLDCTTLASAAEPNASQPEATPASTADQQAPAKKKWQFATIGYAWFAGAHGKTDVIGPAEPVDLDLSFGDVLKAFKFAFMGAAEARHDRLLVLGDLTFIHLDAKRGIGIREPDFLKAELDSKTAEISLLGGYRVLNDGPVAVDLLAGGRMNFFKTTLQLDGPTHSASGSVNQSWFDPLIAARVIGPLGGKWGFSIYGDVGGIITGSDVTWQGVASVDYQISHKMSVGAGWRYFKVNYDNGDFLYDVGQSGPIITFRTAL
jgi:hypothetical protein